MKKGCSLRMLNSFLFDRSYKNKNAYASLVANRNGCLGTNCTWFL